MTEYNPIELLFGGMAKLGPGNDESTRAVLQSLPRQDFEIVVDVGCGTGRQTMVLAENLNTTIHAIDNYNPFLTDLDQRSAECSVNLEIETSCMDMKDLLSKFPKIDLLWSEGAAYCIGFSNALKTWMPALRPDGILAVSELCWISDTRPTEVTSFFETGYPDMKSVPEIVDLVDGMGYTLLSHHPIPSHAWRDGYYDELEPRARALLCHEDAGVKEFAASTLEEIRIFELSEDSYGYVFFVLTPK